MAVHVRHKNTKNDLMTQKKFVFKWLNVRVRARGDGRVKQFGPKNHILRTKSVSNIVFPRLSVCIRSESSFYQRNKTVMMPFVPSVRNLCIIYYIFQTLKLLILPLILPPEAYLV